jgi:hypothetical protein
MPAAKRDRSAPLPPSVKEALLNPVLNEIWLHLLAPVPESRYEPSSGAREPRSKLSAEGAPKMSWEYPTTAVHLKVHFHKVSDR